MKFKIDHIDPLGQGVSKKGEQIAFVSNTLPGESGEACVDKKNKKITFAHLASPDKLINHSSERIAPACPHFFDCPGCSYLHTSYENELKFKKNAWSRIFGKLASMPEVEIISSDTRTQYRNRLQLHYDKRKKILGLKSWGGKNIVPVPECQLPSPGVAKKMAELYQNHTWLKLVENQPDTGHMEIYEREEVQITINEQYSKGGFTQVHGGMNSRALTLINEFLTPQNPTHVLDLFGGGGNLSAALNNSKCKVVDAYPTSSGLAHQEFLTLDLYADNAEEVLYSTVSDAIDTIIIDPPRSGLKEFPAIVSHYGPRTIVYMSCHPPTQARDLYDLQNSYQFSAAYLLDFFPSTSHFESLIFMQKI